MNTSKWKLTKELLENTLLKPSKYSKKGLFLESKEFAGVIQFENSNCKIIDGSKVCEKSYKSHCVVKGDESSVKTPDGKVNFHTHPLKCYIDGEVIWGWPSGEDMAQCIRFAMIGNLYHIIFTIEGTYIISINSDILSNMNEEIIDCIEYIFKLTHRYRLYKDGNKNLNLEFKKFIELSNNGVKLDSTLKMFLFFASNFKIEDCIKYKTIKIPSKIKSSKIFNISFAPNKTIQDPKNPEKSYLVMKNIKTTEQLQKCVKMPQLIKFLN
jgi:hypothetical protein